MSLRFSLLKGASVLTVSQALVAACTFLRNVIIARHIGLENFGIATTFVLTISLVEMTSNLALDRVLVQDREGDSDDMLGSAHFLQFLKGLLIAAILFAIASPVAQLFDLADKVWAFQLLAVVALLHGLMNFDFVVRQRNLDFLPTALFDAIPQVLILGVAFGASLFFEDYRVMLAVILLQAMMHVLLSHLLAKRPYRWALCWPLAKRKLAFGWPLLVNGFLMFGIFQGDRVIIASLYAKETLAWYSVAFSLCMLPTLIFAKLSAYLLMPVLSRSRDNPALFYRCGEFALIACCGFAVLMVVFFGIGGHGLIRLSFGEQYLLAVGVITWLAAMQAVRVIRIAPSVIANSQAHTKNAMIANIFRCISLAAAILLALKGAPVTWIAATGVGGELLALSVSVSLMKMARGKARFVWSLLRQLLLGGALCYVFVTGVPHLLPRPDTSLTFGLLQLAVAGIAAVFAAALLALAQAPVRSELKTFLRRRRETERLAGNFGQ
ncbi:oligosaccharide flippase family protein [Microbulbifer guangxiensis]|uniref:oligosaccharide flippase family protein n=1 Tax=Microbulbifer guangxiensis TaxID=2904249 RepID=UPI00210833A8|nr:oligosaccharide flippase family protein [Microbulbifer guangxiensis]